MSKMDALMKGLFELGREHWIKGLFPLYEEASFTLVKALEQESELVFLVEKGEERLFFSLRFQTQLDPELPKKMEQRRRDLLSQLPEEGVPLNQSVLLFFPLDDNGTHTLSTLEGEYAYQVIRIWEKKKEAVLADKLLGLYPLLPLMAFERGETKEEVLGRVLMQMEEIENQKLKAELWSALFFLTKKGYPRELVLQCARPDLFGQSVLYAAWTAEEARETHMENLRDAVVQVLFERFGTIPGVVMEALTTITEEKDLIYLEEESKRVDRIGQLEQRVRTIVDR